MRNHLIDIKEVSRAALARLPGLIYWMLPNGQKQQEEWVVLNPTRADRRLGSFKVNLKTGKWGDFATGDFGGDIVSLYAYIKGTSQYDAAKRLADALGGEYA